MRLMSRIGVILSTVVVILVGISTMLGLLLGNFTGSLVMLKTLPGLDGLLGGLPDEFSLATGNLAFIFVQVAVVTIALTIIIGILNLLVVNTVRFFSTIRQYPDSQITAAVNSVAIIATFMTTLILYIVDRNRSMLLLEDVQVPIEAGLASLLFFALVYGAFRILRNRSTPARILFVVTVLIVLIGALPISNPIFEQLTVFTDWLVFVPVNAGASGILLGIALATVITGLRILIGQDRTYGE